MSGPIIYRLVPIVPLKEAIDRREAKLSPPAYTVHDLEFGPVGGFIKISIFPANCTPVIHGGSLYGATGWWRWL